MNATLELLRQDPARGGLVRAVGSCLAVGVLMRITPDLSHEISELSVDELPGGFVPMYLVMTGLVVTMVLGANSWTRCSRLSLGLPFTARRTWLVRTAALVTVGLVSVLVLLATMGLSAEPAGGGLVVNRAILLAAARASATVLLLLFVFQLPMPGRDRIPITAGYIVFLVFIGAVVLAISAAGIASMVPTIALFGCAVALGIGLWLRTPPTFSIGPIPEEFQGTASHRVDPPIELATETGGAWLSGRMGVHWIIFRGLKTNVLLWVLLSIVVASAAVVTVEYAKGTNAFLPLFFLVIYHLPLVQAALEGMQPFDSLPISRRALWAHTVVPIVVSAAVGVAIAVSVIAINPLPFAQLRYNGCCVEAPWDYLELSRDGNTSVVTAAWGESYAPKARPLVRGRAISLYDPFEVGPQSSARFVELQMRRAVEAVYGIPVPAALFDPAYESPENIVGGVERGAFTLAVTRGRMSADRLRTAGVALLLLDLVVLTLLLPSLLQYGPSLHRTRFKYALYGLLALLGAATVVVSVARLLGLTEVWYVGALLSVGVRSLSQLLPLSTPAVWIVCVTFWAATYLLLERVFMALEFPREKTMNRFAEDY